MKVYPQELKKLIKKASFNYVLNGVQILFEKDRISSRMISDKKDFAVVINIPQNNVLINGDSPVKVNFLLDQNLIFGKNNSKFRNSNTEKFISDAFKKIAEADSEISDNKFRVIDNGKKVSFPLCEDEMVENNILTEKPIADGAGFLIFDLDQDFLNYFKNNGKILRKVNEFYLIIEDGKAKLQTIEFSKNGKPHALDKNLGDLQKAVSHDLTAVVFDYKNFRQVLDFIDSENYKIQLGFRKDDKLEMQIKSKDGSEIFILLSDEEHIPPEIEQRYRKEIYDDFVPRIEKTPALPKVWHYNDSVKKVKGIIVNWKNLTEEMLKELWIAKKISKRSNSEANKMRKNITQHRTKVQRWMTWTQYCKDIGKSTQVVNWWLEKAFGKDSDGENVPKANLDNDQWILPSDYKESIKRVIGAGYSEKIGKKAKHVFLDIQHQSGREREENIAKLMKKIEDNKVEQAIFLANNNAMCSEFFQPLLDGILCFTNHKIQFEGGKTRNPQGSCFVYFGENKDDFVKEFNKFGTCFSKIEVK